MFGRKVPGRGPAPCKLAFIGEAPGYFEERAGEPFVGDTGKELSRYLSQARLTEDPYVDRYRQFLRDVYLSNVVKYRPVSRKDTGNDPPTAEDIKRDEHELIDELAAVRPEFIGAVGAVSARWLLGSSFHGMEDCYGFPYPLSKHRVKQAGLRRVPTVIPLYHPAAGFHSPGTQPFIYDGIMLMGQYVRGELPLVTPIDRFPDPDYREITTGSVHLMRSMPVYIDTEGLLGTAWGLSFTQTPGCAAVIKVTNRKALRSFRDQLKGMHVVAHHWVHDAPIIAELLDMTVVELFKWIDGPADDTMVKAFVLRMPPLALKPAGRRFHGMTMRSYPDVVRAADHEIASVFLKQLLREKCLKCGGDGQYLIMPTSEKTGKPLMPKVVNCDECEGDGTSFPSPDEYLEYENGEVRMKRGERVGKRVRRVLKDLRIRGGEVDPRDRWERIPYEYRIKIEDQIGEMRPVSLNDVKPQSDAIHYSAKDSDATCRYDGTLDDMLDADASGKLRRVYEIDRNALPLLIRMMEVGTLVDVPFLNKLASRLKNENDLIGRKLQKLVGRYVNPMSSPQVGNLLFDELALPPVKMTKSGEQESTSDAVLEDLKLQVAGWPIDSKQRKALAVLSYITDYRERDKLRGTYAVKLPRAVDKYSRIHTEFRATNTESGRYSSATPNLQNIPNPDRGELGKLIRSAFIAPPGYSIVEVDYSQVEMRVLAHESQDEKLCEAIRSGFDIHKNTAMMIFRVTADHVESWMRTASKTLGFGIVYGISAPALKAQIKLRTGLDVTEEDAKGYIETYKEVAYPGIGDYMLECYAFARRYGYAEDMFGRRRYLPGMHSVIRKVKAESERISVNHPIQAGAGGIMKLASPIIMDETLPRVRKAGYDCDPLLTEHDALVFQVKHGGEEMLIELASEAMTRSVKLRVPLTVDGHAASSWGSCKG